MPVKGNNSMMFATGFDNSGLKTGAQEAFGIVSALGRKIAIFNPFVALGAGAASIFAGVAAEAFAFAKRYEQAMLEVKTISTSAQADFQGLKGSIFKLSQDTLDDPVQLAQAYYQIVSAGYDGAEGLRLLETASRAAVAGVTDTQTAADGITTVLNAFGESAENADQVADAMFKTVELGKTTFSQLSAKMATAAPLAASLGVSYQEVLAAVASLTKQGTPTAEAMTQIRAALVSLNDNMKDGWAETYTFQEALQEMYNKAGGNKRELKELSGSIEAVSAILGLAGEKAQGATSDLEKLKGAVGSADAAFNRMTEGQSNALQILGNRVRALTEGLGEGLLSVANDTAQFLLDITKSEGFAGDTYRKEMIALEDLRLELQRGGVAQERRVEIIKKLKEQYPNLLQNIADDEAYNGKLETALEGVNNQLLQRLRLERNKEQIQDADQAYLKSFIAFKEKEKEVARAINKLREENFTIRKRTESVMDRSLGDQVAVIKSINSEQSRNVEFLYAQARKLGKEQFQNQTALNELLGKGNELQKGIVEFGGKTGSEVIDPIVKSAEDNKKTYADYLNDMRSEYEAYEAAKTVFGEEGANKRFEVLIAKGDSYRDFLLGELALTKSIEDEKVLVIEAANNDISNLFEKQKKVLDVVSVGSPDLGDFSGKNKIELPVFLGIKQESINEVQNAINIVQSGIDATEDEGNRKELLKYLEHLKKKLELKKSFTEEGIDDEKKRQELLQNFSLRALKERLKKEKELYKGLAETHGEKSVEALDALNKIEDTKQKIFSNIQQTADQFSSMFSSLAGAFETFGADELGGIANQLAGVASGIGKIATGNPMAVIGGIADIVSSAFKVEIVADTAKFEKQMKSLEKTIVQLETVLNRSIGLDRISDRKSLIEKQIELEKKAEEAANAEEKARKTVKFLGIGVGDKGEGSGTDPEKIEELEEAAESARQEVLALQDELNQLFTGTTRDSIVDSLLDGFEQGKRGAEDFAETFEDLMRNAVLESLKLKYLEKAVEGFFQDFADAAESDGALSSDEIKALRSQFNALVERSERELEALNGILSDAGIEATDIAQNRQGLSGEIKTVTEDTANVLAGALNKIMIDTAIGTNALLTANIHLAQMSSKLAIMVELNTIANTRLLNIEKNLS